MSIYSEPEGEQSGFAIGRVENSNNRAGIESSRNAGQTFGARSIHLVSGRASGVSSWLVLMRMLSFVAG